MNCPNCKSTYTEVTSTKETVNQIEDSYRCLSCGHTFKKISKKEKPASRVLMTIHGGLRHFDDYTDAAEITETEQGTLYIKQKATPVGGKTEFVDTTTVPKFKVTQGTMGMRLTYDSFSYMNDKKGHLFSVYKIVLNDDLLTLARQSEAMKIALKGDFLTKPQKSSVVLDDVARWLNNSLSPYKNKNSVPVNQTPTESKGGCYVATAVYGSYDCPEVWTLRRYRDDILAQTWYGRAVIIVYYAISPTLVKWFGKAEWFKRLWRGKLDRMVSKLRSEGIESTPYRDKKW